MYWGEMVSKNSVPDGTPMFAKSNNSPRDMRKPRLMSKESSSAGSLIKPFQPTVVRGFSK
jgi:hypothetical protein